MKTEETKQIKAVIFDMDGVLLDSESVCDRCFDQAAIEQNEKVARFVQNPATRQENFQARITTTRYAQTSANEDFLESVEIV